ncbi:MAG: glucokinase [Desulfomonile tiedjei]|nr:glucokinase [Desulfomonile tiedjei]
MSGAIDRTTVLAGDVGGTKTNLGLFVPGAARPELVTMESFTSKAAVTLSDLIAAFIADKSEPIASACFGIPGPVIEGSSKTTNLPWKVSEQVIKDDFGWKKVRLINDLTATAHAVPLLRNDEIFELNPVAENAKGNMGIVAPGTGLGVALIVTVGKKLHPVPSEGGHADFAPTDGDQADLLKYLRNKFDHVSVERVISGPGLADIYSWLRDRGDYDEPDWLAERLKSEDPPMVISDAALDQKEPLCIKALEIFVSILGAYAGNLALTGMTTGGIYLGGGISPKILPKLKEGAFMKAFTAKGRFKELLSQMPVRVILNDKAALLGAAWCALQNLSED